MGMKDQIHGGGNGWERAAAITGMGVVTPGGSTVGSYWEALCAGRSVAKPIQSFDTSGLTVRFGCEVLDFDPTAYLGAKEARRTDRFAQFAIAAASQALADAGNPVVAPERAGIVAGTGNGGTLTNERQGRNFAERGPEHVHPLFVPMTMLSAAAGLLSMRLGWTGPNITLTTACATGSHALGEALRLIRDGSADIVLAGASEASMTPFVLTGFANLQALSTRNDEPSRASRPFDAQRDGFVMGEGAAFCVLERLSLARERGARVHALLAGYGRNADAYHLAMPEPDGAGAVACMQLALHDAGIAPEDVVHVNTHGTSTDLNDKAEARALHKVFSGSPPPVTANKGVVGHLIAAAGAVEAVAVCLSLAHGLIPPVANYENPDPEVDLDVVAGGTREFQPGPVVSNSFGFGGQNASLVIVPETTSQ